MWVKRTSRWMSEANERAWLLSDNTSGASSSVGYWFYPQYPILFTCQRERFEELLLEKKTIFFGFQSLSEKFSDIWQKFLAGFSKQQFTSPVEHFDDKQGFEKIKSFHVFRTLIENISDFWRWISGKFVKNAIWVSRVTFWEINRF